MNASRIFCHFISVNLMWVTACSRKIPKPPPAAKTPNVTHETVRSDSLATIEKIQNEVSTRRAGTVSWERAQVQAPLLARDAVMTGTNSQSLLQFKDRTQITMEEKTMVIVYDHQVQNTVVKSIVDLPSGDVLGEIPSETSQVIELTIRTPRGWVRASNKEHRKKRQKVKFETRVDPKGNLTVVNKGAPLKVAVKDLQRSVRIREKLFIPATQEEQKRHVQQVEKIRRGTVSTEKLFVELPTVNREQVKLSLLEESEEVNRKPAKSTFFEITYPKEDLTVLTTKEVVLRGKFSSDLKVFLNGAQIAADKERHFKHPFPLDKGLNTLTFQIFGPEANRVRYETREIVRK